MTDNQRIRPNALRVRRMGIDTYQEPVVYMRADCHICKSEGFEAQSQVMIDCEKRDIFATLNVVHDQNAIDGLT